MRREGDERDGIPTAGPGAVPPRPGLLRVPDSGVAVSPPQAVQLCREFKGPLWQDLLREDVSAGLPGRAVRALEAIERGDFATADGLLPGTFQRVIEGPWRRSRGRHLLLLLVALALVLAVALALVLA